MDRPTPERHLRRLMRLWPASAPWLADLSEAERVDLARELTLTNLARLRLLAWGLILAFGFYSALELVLVPRLVRLPTVTSLLPFFVGGRLVMITGALVFLLLVARRRQPAEVTRRDRFLVTGFPIFVLVGAAVLSALSQSIQLGLDIYLLAVFIIGAFLRLSLRNSLAVLIPGWVTLAVLIRVFMADLYVFLAGLVNGSLATVLALYLARLTYTNRARQWRDRRLIERNEAELTSINARLSQANQMLTRLSYIDALTGIPNRRYFDEFFEREWKRAARERHPLALIMVDIDHFKQFNDTYGHQEGDQCLIQVSRTLRSALLRPGDLVARYGGEEFAAVLPGTTQADARLIAERMRGAVAAQGIPNPASPLSGLTVSLGVSALVPRHDVALQTLIERADQALYQAKEQGRNRTCCQD
jgi:diguanylate cyclase (GGDEF)-like protein